MLNLCALIAHQHHFIALSKMTFVLRGVFRGGGHREIYLFIYLCSSPNFGRKIRLNLSEDFFFCFSSNFGRKIGLNLSEDLFLLFT